MLLLELFGGEVAAELGGRVSCFFYVCLVTFIMLFKFIAGEKICLMIVSNVLCSVEHMAEWNSSDALSFLICNYFYTLLY